MEDHAVRFTEGPAMNGMKIEKGVKISFVTKTRSYPLRNEETILPKTLIPLDNHLVSLPE